MVPDEQARQRAQQPRQVGLFPTSWESRRARVNASAMPEVSVRSPISIFDNNLSEIQAHRARAI
jgi:hypothetical protein